MWQRLTSLRHGFWLRVSESIAWSRGTYLETPARELQGPSAAKLRRILELKQRYGVKFEQHLSEPTSLRNYEYLDLLDRGWTAFGGVRPQGGEGLDVGSASFWYAAALHAFFRPAALTGIEIEGHRLLRNGHSRLDYARGYVGQLPNTEFMIADFLRWKRPVDLITAWFPFLTPAAILAWRLPLSLLAPQDFFAQVRRNLRPHGLFFMVNHGPGEADLAEARCNAAGLERLGRWQDPSVLSDYRLSPPVLSWWRAA